MARTLRPNPAGWFHLMNRGSRRWNIFLDDFDRHRFLDLLEEMASRFEIEVIAYALMGNHYHILVHCIAPNLSEAMHWFTSQYVRGFNKRHGFDGTLFRSRYHSVKVNDDAQLLTTVRYIHRNPLDLNPDADLASYHWSSHAAYLGWRPPPSWLSTAVVRSQFGNLDKYQEFVETALPSDQVQNSRLSRRTAIDSTEVRTDTLSSPADVQRAAAAAAGTDVRSIQQPIGHQAKRARLAAVVVCVDNCNMSPKSLVDTFGFPSEGALSMALTRARRRLGADGEFISLVAQVQAALISLGCQAP